MRCVVSRASCSRQYCCPRACGKRVAVTEESKVATPSQVKRIIRRRIAKHPVHEEMGLNIYPMMDMMTILLVFLIQSFAQSSAANVLQSSELQIPQSTSATDVDPALSITISASEIV